ELDDPQPLQISRDFRTAVATRARSSRRWRSALRAGSCLAVLAISLPLGYAAYEYHRLDDVHRLTIPSVGDGLPVITATPTSAPATGTVPAGGASPSTGPSLPAARREASTILIVGSDERDTDAALGARYDTIMVVRLDPASSRLTVLSIPRDLWLTGPSGTPSRINTLDAEALTSTIENLLNIQIDHFAQVSFDGFKRLINLVGGVSVTSDAALRDKNTGFTLAAATCTRLDGDQALAFVRSRHMQSDRNGKWVEDPRSDFGRIADQQLVMRALAQQLFASLPGPTSIGDFVDAAVDDVTVDSGFSAQDMVSTALAVRRIGTAATQFATVQVSGKVIAGQDVLVASSTQISAAARFLADGTSAITPATPQTSPSTTSSSVPVITAC
ncbi:MAG TPA: LCP family protein, partial [Ilumatobacteraceae bacterium]